MLADLDRPTTPSGAGFDDPSGSTRGLRATGGDSAAPDEVAPQRVRARVAAVTRTAPTRRLQPGDLICGQCGEGNAPTRKFCSRCGDGLASAEMVRAPWWRRFVPRRGPRTAAAGSRPGRAGAVGEAAPRRSPVATLKDAYRRSRAALGVIGLSVALLIAFVPPLRGQVTSWFTSPVDRAKTRVEQAINPTFLPVRPIKVMASSARSKHPAELAFDQGSNTYWSARWNPAGQPRLIVTFAAPVNLSRLIVISGAGKSFTKIHRPATLHLVYSTRRSDTFAVPDSADPVTFTLNNAEAVTRVEIIIQGIHPAQKSSSVALAELEFFIKE